MHHMLVDAVCHIMLINERIEVDICVVRQEEQYSGDQKFVVSIVDFQPLCRSGSVAKVDKGLARRLVQQECIGKASKSLS